MRELVQQTAGRLEAAGLDEARLKSELLIAHVLGMRRFAIYAVEDKPVPAELEQLVARALRGEPIQYIIGDTNFLGHTIRCDARALIPRPETEQLVELVLSSPEGQASPRPSQTGAAQPARPEFWTADVGTGTGCIAIALALAQPRGRYLATDISEDALDLARENARALGARVDFRRADLLDGVAAGSLDAVVSNPPYVAVSEWASLQKEVRDFEPRLALDGGEEGLDVIARLVPQAFRSLRGGGRLYLEIGETQGARVAALMHREHFSKVRIERDAAGLERFAIGVKP